MGQAIEAVPAMCSRLERCGTQDAPIAVETKQDPSQLTDEEPLQLPKNRLAPQKLKASIERELAIRHLADFVRQAWPIAKVIIATAAKLGLLHNCRSP